FIILDRRNIGIRIAKHPPDQMCVGVDEAWQQRDVTKIEDLCIPRDRYCSEATYGRNLVVRDYDHRVRKRRSACAVDQARRVQRDRAFALRWLGSDEAGPRSLILGQRANGKTADGQQCGWN